MTNPAIQPASLPFCLSKTSPPSWPWSRATLERNGYEVVCIESGAEALRLLEEGQFLGVVSDMRTPGGVDGAQVHAWISAHRPELERQAGHHYRRYTPMKKPLPRCARSARSIVEKPFRVQDFISAVEKTMGKAR